MLILNTKGVDEVVSESFILTEGGLTEETMGIIDYDADEFVIEPLSMESLIKKANLLLLESVKRVAYLSKTESVFFPLPSLLTRFIKIVLHLHLLLFLCFYKPKTIQSLASLSQ